MQNIQLETQDFETSINLACAGDLVYADPPYTVAHNENGFVKYNQQIFSYSDQVRLSKVAKKAAARGVRVLISNADHHSIHSLYEGSQVKSLQRASVMCSKREGRRQITELLIEVKP